MTSAPLVIKDKVIVGTAGGEFGIRGFIAAYDGADGEGGLAVQYRSAAW
jgi:alcohol dehydrogenase (cytochrome c)